ncbi:MAG: peptide ABC transporter substrate-binding protein [Coprobacillaceae bacterium]
MKSFRKFLSIFLCAMILVGCGSSGDKDSGSGDKKKVINIAAAADIMSMDTSYATDGDSFTALRLVNEGLYYVNAENGVEFGVAESLEKSDDGLVYTFKLRDDAKWSNGDDVTANDFVYAWKRLADPERAVEYAYMIGESGINVLNGEAAYQGEASLDDLGLKAVDEKTFEVTLAAPCAYFESLMSFPIFYPINQKFAEEAGDAYATDVKNMLFNGPYTATKWEHGSVMELAKNDTYWAKDEIKLDGINIKTVKDVNSAILAFQNGELDYCGINGETVAEWKDDEAYFEKLTGYYWYVTPNIDKMPDFQNKNLRLAFQQSFDKEDLVENVLKDGSSAANYVIPKTVAYLDGEDFRDTAGEYAKFDLEAAQAYYEEAKKELGKDTFTFDLKCFDDELAQKTAQFLKEQWETNLPGVTVNLVVKPKKAVSDEMKPDGGRDFEMGFTRWGPDYADPSTYANLWITKETSWNYGEWANEEYSELVTKAGVGEDVGDPEKRWQDYIDAEKIMLEDGAIFPVYQLGGASLKNPKMKNLYYTAVNNECYRYVELED